MKISEIMSANVVRVAPGDPCLEAGRLMDQHDCGAIPVADKDKLVGMVTDRDLAVRLVGRGRDPATAVRDVMTRGVRYCYDTDEVSDVAQNMALEQIRRLPVVNAEKRLVGIVSLGDIALASAEDGGEALEGISKPARSAANGGHAAARLS